MSSQFQVDTDRITAASGDITRIGAEIDAQVSAMMARLTGLQDAWRGTAATRFQGVATEWRGTQARVRGVAGPDLPAAGAGRAAVRRGGAAEHLDVRLTPR